jgi:hypothetical protein
MSDQERPTWVTPRRDGPLDLVTVFLVVAGEAAQVPVRHADQSGGIGQAQLIVGRTQGPDLSRIDSRVSGMGAAGQLAGPHPPRTVALNQRYEVGTSRLAELPGHSANGRSNGRSRLVSCRGLRAHGLR